jgi:hypothetical protein
LGAPLPDACSAASRRRIHWLAAFTTEFTSAMLLNLGFGSTSPRVFTDTSSCASLLPPLKPVHTAATSTRHPAAPTSAASATRGRTPYPASQRARPSLPGAPGSNGPLDLPIEAAFGNVFLF